MPPGIILEETDGILDKKESISKKHNLFKISNQKKQKNKIIKCLY